jgi:hypothetical protein
MAGVPWASFIFFEASLAGASDVVLTGSSIEGLEHEASLAESTACSTSSSIWMTSYSLRRMTDDEGFRGASTSVVIGIKAGDRFIFFLVLDPGVLLHV